MTTGRTGWAQVRKVTAENQGSCSQKVGEVDPEDLRLFSSFSGNCCSSQEFVKKLLPVGLVYTSKMGDSQALAEKRPWLPHLLTCLPKQSLEKT